MWPLTKRNQSPKADDFTLPTNVIEPEPEKTTQHFLWKLPNTSWMSFFAWWAGLSSDVEFFRLSPQYGVRKGEKTPLQSGRTHSSELRGCPVGFGKVCYPSKEFIGQEELCLGEYSHLSHLYPQCFSFFAMLIALAWIKAAVFRKKTFWCYVFFTASILF